MIYLMAPYPTDFTYFFMKSTGNGTVRYIAVGESINCRNSMEVAHAHKHRLNKKINLKRLYPRDYLEFHGNNCMTLGSN